MRSKLFLKFGSAALAFSIVASASAQLDVTGQWGPVKNWPLVAIHQHYLMNGKILVFGRGDLGDYATVFDPVAHTFTPIGSLDTDIFCAGHSFLSDGTVFIAGGHVIDGWGLKDTMIYNPFDGANGTWIRKPDMSFARWYPTCTTMPDGRVVTVSGSVSLNEDGSKVWASKPEVYDPETSQWTVLPDEPRLNGYYRLLHVIPNGKLYYAGSTIWFSLAMDPNTGTWSTVSNNSNVYGMSSVSYAPGKILKSGGPVSGADLTGTNGAAVIDFNAPTPQWTTIAPMAFERREHDLTVLPDGTVLCTGGSDVFDNPQSAVYQAELFNPATMTWQTLPSMTQPRSYHSSAILLRDGTVLVAGGGNGGGRRAEGTTDYLNSEVYSPAYLFKGPRPNVSSVPKVTTYGSTFTVGTANPNDIAKVSLIAPGSVTHGFDMNQRYLPLQFQVVNGELQIQAPANANLAPPGPYMLFLVNSNGVPSIGEFMILSEAMPSVAPTGFTATALPTGDVSTLAASDNQSLQLKPLLVNNRLAVVSLTMTGVSPRKHISSIALDFESRHDRVASLKLELWDYENLQWVQIFAGGETQSDTVKKGLVSGYASKFVNTTTKEIKARATWTALTLSSREPNVPPFLIDQVKWTVTR